MVNTMKANFSFLLSLFNNYRIDGYIIPSKDEFSNEYVPSHLKRLKFITGFTGSNGVAIISNGKRALWTDGRYLTQARKQLPKSFDILDMTDNNSAEWFKGLKGMTMGYDPMLHSENDLKKYEQYSYKYHFTLKGIEENLVDLISGNIKAKSICKPFNFDIKYAGISSKEKIEYICNDMHEDTDYLFLNDLSSICWLLNIRGGDVEYNPYVISFLLLSKKDREITLFTNPQNSESIVKDGITIKPLIEFKTYFKQLARSNKIFQFDPNKAPIWCLNQVSDDYLIRAEDPCLMPKALKNKTEIQGIKDAHLQDGIALCKFLYWFENSPGEAKTEISAAEKLLSLRKERELFQYESFPAISAYGANGAIIHYCPDNISNSNIGHESLYLIDSGGQYLNGTTDVTRTICLSDNPSSELKEKFTIVLKAHIALAMQKFSKNTTGSELDAITRSVMNNKGLDYPHGTGHGVGHFSGVHEGPACIGRKSDVKLQEKMLFSNEPGFYYEDKYGIRIENLMFVTCNNSDLLEFETITLAPMDVKLINFDLLDKYEISWLIKYHQKTYDKIAHYLNDSELRWMQEILVTIKNRSKYYADSI